MENYNGQQYNVPTTPTAPVVPVAPAKRGGRKMAVAALLMAIASNLLGFVSAWFVFWYTYGRQPKEVVIVSLISAVIVVPAILAIVFGKKARKLGSGKALWIPTLINAIFGLGFIFFNLRALINVFNLMNL